MSNKYRIVDEKNWKGLYIVWYLEIVLSPHFV